jgi:hypothetical protein
MQRLLALRTLSGHIQVGFAAVAGAAAGDAAESGSVGVGAYAYSLALPLSGPFDSIRTPRTPREA